MKVILLFVFIIIIASCQTRNEKNSEEKIKQIYMNEINESIAAFEKRMALNKIKTRPWYGLAKKINENFQKIDSIIKTEKNYEQINELLNASLDLLWSEHLKNDSSIRIRVDAIKEAIKNNKMDEFAYQFLLIDLNGKLIRNIYHEIDRTDYKFEKIEAIVFPKKEIARVGEMYEARILIAAFDSTRNPSISIQGNPIPIKNGLFVYKEVASSKGLKHKEGEIEIRNEQNEKIRLPFTIEYEVK